ncbi:MAG: flagellar hook-associated protein FlgL, partial [Christensenellales bacterium]
MRVTNNMMVNNLMRNLYKNYTKMDRAQQMLSSQKKFLRPSDDPIGVTRSLRLTTEILNMEQYKRNVDDSDSWIQSSEQVINNMMSVMQRIRELTVQGANEPYSQDDRKKIADEIRELKEQLIGLGNTAYAGSYLFSGYKTDKPLLNKDGTYDLDGGILSIAENIEVNVGISDRMGINFIGQRLFGHMATRTYDEYILKGNGIFTGADLSTNNEFVISYNGTDYTVTMPAENYNSFEGGKFVENLNAAIAVVPPLGDLIEAYIEDGEIVLRGAREFQILSMGTTMDVKDAMGIDTDTAAALTKVIVSDFDDIDNPISQGAVEHLLKAEGNFIGTAAGDEFKIYYGDYEYTVKMDRDYRADEDKEFIYDFNKKLAQIDDLAGHAKLYEKDGKFAISVDKKFRIEENNFANLGFEEAGSGLKSVRTQYGVEGAALKISDNPVDTTTIGNTLYFIYGDKNYTITLNPAKNYDGITNTFDDLINDIQAAINDTDLKGYVTVTGSEGRIQFNADSQFELDYNASNSQLMDSIGFNTSKTSVLIDKRVESGSSTQLIGMIDRLIEDLNGNNTEGINKALSRLDAHIGNLNALRAEMGVKTNRLELTKN